MLKLKHDWSSHTKKLVLTFYYAVFGLSRVNDDIIEAPIWVLESAGNLFRLQYEIHRLQMHPKLLCRSVVAPTPNLTEQQYALWMIVVPCQYFTSPSPSFQPISPSLSSHISSVAVPHLLCCCIHICCPASPPTCSSAAVFIFDLVFHTHYPGATIFLQVRSRYLLIFPQTVAVLPNYFAVSVVPHRICCRPTSTLSPYPSLLSRISATVLFHRCLHHWSCLPSLLSRIYATTPLLTSQVSVTVLIAWSSIIPCTSPLLFFYLLRLVLLLALHRSVLHWFLRSAPH